MTARKLSVVVAGCATLWATGAQAQSGLNWGQDGSLVPSRGYVGLSVGRAEYDPDCVAGFSCDENRTAFKITAGGVASDIWGAEVAYLNLGRIGYGGGSQRAQGINLSLVGSYPLSPQFSAFGKIGTTFGWTKTRAGLAGGPDGTDNGFGLSFGIGAAYKVTPRWEAVVEWERHRFDFEPGDQNISLLTVGARYHFER